jgi:large subunit ribosomal protein L25
MQVLEVQADLRPVTGGGSARNLIREGKIPAVVYGNHQENVSICLEAKVMEKLLKSGSITSTVIDLNLSGKVHKTLVKQIQKDPVKDTLRHVDLVFINPNGQEVDVPIIFESKEKCLGVKRGGFFNIIHRKLKLICDPSHIPEQVSVNVIDVKIGGKVLASQIPLPEGSKLAVKHSTIIATITGRGKGGSEEDDKKGAPAAK